MPQAETAGRALRADARHNREVIIAAAEDLFSRHGANASLEEIARRAGVGSATLHRHFRTRKNLLETVFFDHVKDLCDAAESISAAHNPAEALITWLRLVGLRATENNGLAVAITAEDGGASDSLQSCHAKISAAGSTLLDRAIESGAVRPDVEIHDLLALVNALARAHGEPGHKPGDGNRLLTLAITGIMTSPPEQDPAEVQRDVAAAGSVRADPGATSGP